MKHLTYLSLDNLLYQLLFRQMCQFRFLNSVGIRYGKVQHLLNDSCTAFSQ